MKKYTLKVSYEAESVDKARKKLQEDLPTLLWIEE